jgi:uncharacterized protein YodC (DUF2158 family)
MAAHDFKSGDVVRLKSGGENMTISEVDGDDAHLTWMDNGKLVHDVLKHFMLGRPPNPNDRGSRVP